MKIPVLLLCFSIIFYSAFSQSTFDKSLNEVSADIAGKLSQKNKKKIVVLYVTDINKAQTVAGKYMADVISVNLVNDQGNFDVFDRENLSEIVEAKKMISEGYIDATKAKVLGKILSVDVIIVGNYTVLTNTLKLTLRALDVNNGFVIAAKMKDLPLNEDANTLLGISISNSNKGFNNRPLNSNESYNNPETVNKNCLIKKTGDYCIFNSTKSPKAFRFYYGEKPFMNYGPLNGNYYEDIILLKGETKCLYNKGSKSHLFEIYSRNSEGEVELISSGSILIEICKSKTFTISQ